MPKIKIEGGHKLTGEIEISGSKNSAVALIPASILCDEVVKISNVPDISDIDNIEKMFSDGIYHLTMVRCYKPLPAEYVDGNVDRNKEIDILKSSLESAGLSFGEDEHGAWLIVNSKEEYFKAAFEKFKEQLAKLANYSLKDFSGVALDMYYLNKYYDDKQSVYFSADGEPMTLDTFIRRCLADEKYYIGGVVGYKC